MKQKSVAELQNEQMRDRTIRPAFLGMTGALPARPASQFDNAARTTCATTPWNNPLQKAARAASAEAARIGKPIVVATTRQRITELYELLLADALAPLPPEGDLCVVEAVLASGAVHGPAEMSEDLVLVKPTCRERLLTLARNTNARIRSLKTVASAAEHKALNPQTTGMRACR